MQFLLDTHTFIWFINGDSSLPNKIIDEIKNLKNQCFISIASIW
jgi:PIN domain nuclease of toxin-antitoxin system